jgi:hypothetical protein
MGLRASEWICDHFQGRGLSSAKLLEIIRNHSADIEAFLNDSVGALLVITSQ